MAKKNVDFLQAYGDAPTFDDVEVGTPEFRTRYINALNWASAAFKIEELKDMTISYLENGDLPVKGLALLPPHLFSAIGKIAWLRSRSIELEKENIAFFDKKLAEIRELAKVALQEKKIEDEAKANTPVKTPKTDFFRVYNRIEDLIDEGTSGEIYDLMVEFKSRQGVIPALKEHFTKALEEYTNARSDELAEYFEDVTDEEINYRVKAYNRVLEDIEAITANKRATRKARKKRAPKVEKQVSRVNYKTNDNDLKVVSVDPANVVGAPALITFNTKTRRVALFVAAKEEGLQIQGTTLKGFDPKKSITKTLRKPEEQLNGFRRASNVNRAEVLLTKNIRGKVFPVSGRINKDTLLLKVLKG